MLFTVVCVCVGGGGGQETSPVLKVLSIAEPIEYYQSIPNISLGPQYGLSVKD